jgi:hypothetical protein
VDFRCFLSGWEQSGGSNRGRFCSRPYLHLASRIAGVKHHSFRQYALISWPASSTGFGLQENPDLNSKNWTDLTSTPTLTNQQNQIIVSTLNGARFYRLNHP